MFSLACEEMQESPRSFIKYIIFTVTKGFKNH